MELSLTIRNIRNIKTADIALPLDKGLYAIVGEKWLREKHNNVGYVSDCKDIISTYVDQCGYSK